MVPTLAAEPLPELKAAFSRLGVPGDLRPVGMTSDQQFDLALHLGLAQKDVWPDTSALHDAVQVLEKGTGADHPLTALFRAREASLRDQETGPGYPGKDAHEASLRRSLRALSALPPAHPARMEATAHLARYLLARFRLAEAERLLAPQQSTASPQAAALADLRHVQARYAEAERIRRRALASAASPAEAARLKVALAGDLLAQGASVEAGRILQETVGTLQPELGSQPFLHSDLLEGLGDVAIYEGRLQEANTLHQRSYGLLEGKVSSNHPRVALKLMKSISASAAAGEPEAVWGRRVPMIAGDASPADSVSLAATAWEANHPRRAARPEDRREYVARHLAFSERVLGPAHPEVAHGLFALAGIAHEAGRDNEAEPLARRALTIRAAALGPRHLHTLEATELLARVLETLGRTQDAKVLVRQAAADARQALAETQPLRWRMRARTARLLDQEGLHARAAAEWRHIIGWLRSDAPVPMADRLLWTTQALESELAAGNCPGDELAALVLANHRRHGGSDWGSGTPDLLRAAANYAHAEALACKGDRDGAVAAFRAMESNLLLVADSHPQKLLYRGRRVLRLSEDERTAREASGSYGNYNAALLAGVRARRTLYAGSQQDQLLAARSAAGPADHDGLDIAFQAYLNSAWKALKPQLDSWGPAGTVSADVMRSTLYEPVRDEAFIVAQELHASTAAQALAEAAARARYNDARLDRLVKQRKELAASAVALDRRLLAAAAGAAKEDTAALDAQLRAAIAALAPVSREIATQFPEYAALTNPHPLAAAAVRESLKEAEGLLLIVPSGKDVHVFALTRDQVVWHSRTDGAAYADSRIRRLRCQVDASTCSAAPAPGNGAQAEPLRGAARVGGGHLAAAGFDVQAAHELYREFVAPVAPALAKVRSLMIATAGSFSSLPPGLLVTEPPAVNTEPAWLSERFVLTVLPAVSSLARRGGTGPEKFTRYLVGFGDPAFQGDRAATRSIPPLPVLFSGRGELGARANPTELRRLARLPGTAAELKAMAKAVGPNRATIRLGEQASESAVKRSTELPQAQVVVFATHGLLPRSLNSVTEPGLAFTPPGKASDLDDGLLTASEAAALRLKAEFVILSACNTASGDDRPGAESLSGLARSLLHAGARSLLVSHWEVRDDATAALTVETLRLRDAEPALGRAGALQAAMRAVRTGKRLDGSPLPGWKADWAQPAAWGPFVLIQAGE
jgi:CHAT domain-containing protein